MSQSLTVHMCRAQLLKWPTGLYVCLKPAVNLHSGIADAAKSARNSFFVRLRHVLMTARYALKGRR